MTKTCAAFRLSAQRLFDDYPKIYFWTVTFYAVHDDWEATALFGKFLNHLIKVAGKNWGGLRVAELHKNHGVHFHMLVNDRLAVDLVRRIGAHYGVGRVQVARVQHSRGGNSIVYLSKYLSKRRAGPLTESGRSARRWAKFGDVQHTRVCDLVNDSPMWIYRRENGLGFRGYRWETVLARCWEHGEDAFRLAWVRSHTDSQDVFAIAEGVGEVVGRVGRMGRLEMVFGEMADLGNPF